MMNHTNNDTLFYYYTNMMFHYLQLLCNVFHVVHVKYRGSARPGSREYSPMFHESTGAGACVRPRHNYTMLCQPTRKVKYFGHIYQHTTEGLAMELQEQTAGALSILIYTLYARNPVGASDMGTTHEIQSWFWVGCSSQLQSVLHLSNLVWGKDLVG